MALSGTLKDFGIADIFQLIGQQQKTGVLHLTERDEEVHVAFKDGNIVRAECATRKKKELLGDMLVRAGLVSEGNLAAALEEQKRTLKRLGDILVQRGAVERSSLREMAQLQTCETIYRLFGWKNGTYAFETAEVEFDPETVTPIRSESVLMEGFRRVDEWPLIRKRINSPTMTFERAKDLPPPPVGGEDLDRSIDEAFDGPKSHKDDDPVGPNERRLWGLVEPGRDLSWLIDRSRLGEFEASKALLNLVNGGYLRPFAGKPKPEVAQGSSRRRKFAEFVVASTGKLAAAVVLLAALGGVALVAPVSPLAPPAPSHQAQASDPGLRRALGRAHLSRVQMALSVFTLERGRSPSTLAEVVAAGLLTEAELRRPWDGAYYYRKTGETTWVVLPPLQ